ncbi:MAG TPA: imidazoleglycerol-phosphate dehydratase HisB [Elusimicrobia bacterium]|nr:MAG: imidazoleglycerol-phosphate dehydratase [Elusimicrobia bacterium RIFOXYA12_FULL_49_49]OGS09244.1 MAG: imidazoleglycerol-phosphate dehydratase [Elusimicrobia bacterium RIFOXYA1_FULL_47_7]OGS11893.1 MAG: imidazoleglycerol-phosphate dehydratase [Elusimicrobia bacterium RIFOXYB1_FULL_48_9]OGS16849.1 MAG: imidazoleglycerol-phosphate dehydratase [Elusimicrobia bacterium RIFOXYA2_FULL_47_53]OGS32077.1 MAG: imidazoleglycerol-phosphate dehydratase [Elusimicrobia bacterium RIFOXYB2_FULL_46_23]HB
MKSGTVSRITKETSIKVALNLKKNKPVKIATTIPFIDHMLELFAHHAGISLVVSAAGDTHIDDHHLVEDLGITVGKALKIALGDKKGINRYGNFLLPMDEALSYVAMDISGRPYLEYDVKFKAAAGRENFDFGLLNEFFYALAVNAGITLHIALKKGRNNHHIAESIFKGFGRALSQAVSKSRSTKGIPSTKGSL